MAIIFHITSGGEWRQASQNGRYEAPSLAEACFIHCSDRNQVVRVANHIYRGQTGLVLLHISPDKLTSRVVYENLEGGQELFPHVYGFINIDAVIAVTPFEPGEHGRFDHHDKADFS